MTQHRRPTPPEIVANALRSVSPPEQAAYSGPGAGPPAWFVALSNLESKLLGELVKHEAKDAERHATQLANHEEQAQRIKALEAKVGLAGLIGAGLGGAAPQLIEWLLR